MFPSHAESPEKKKMVKVPRMQFPGTLLMCLPCDPHSELGTFRAFGTHQTFVSHKEK